MATMGHHISILMRNLSEYELAEKDQNHITTAKIKIIKIMEAPLQGS